MKWEVWFNEKKAGAVLMKAQAKKKGARLTVEGALRYDAIVEAALQWELPTAVGRWKMNEVAKVVRVKCLDAKTTSVYRSGRS